MKTSIIDRRNAHPKPARGSAGDDRTCPSGAAALGPVFLDTGTNSAQVTFPVKTANMIAWIIICESGPQRLATEPAALTESPFLSLLMINLLLLFVGTVIYGIAALVIVVPILPQIAQSQLGIDPFHFGVVTCIDLVLGLLTPPVGPAYIAPVSSIVKRNTEGG